MGYIYYAIGLHRPAPDAQLQWTDGSPLDFTNWIRGYPVGHEGYDITLLLAVGSDYPDVDQHQYNGRWVTAGDYEYGVRGVCQM